MPGGLSDTGQLAHGAHYPAGISGRDSLRNRSEALEWHQRRPFLTSGSQTMAPRGTKTDTEAAQARKNIVNKLDDHTDECTSLWLWISSGAHKKNVTVEKRDSLPDYKQVGELSQEVCGEILTACLPSLSKMLLAKLSAHKYGGQKDRKLLLKVFTLLFTEPEESSFVTRFKSLLIELYSEKAKAAPRKLTTNGDFSLDFATNGVYHFSAKEERALHGEVWAKVKHIGGDEATMLAGPGVSWCANGSHAPPHHKSANFSKHSGSIQAPARSKAVGRPNPNFDLTAHL